MALKLRMIVKSILVGVVLLTLQASPSWSLDEDIENRFIYADYSKKISMDFKDASLIDVLKIFSKQSGMNFIAAGDVSNKKITLYLDNISIEEALDKILDANGLTYEMSANSDVFIVKEKPKVQLITKVFPLKNASVSKASIASKGTMAGVADAIKDILSKDGKILEDTRTNSLVISDIPEQFPLIEELIAKLDTSVAQIMIQVEMLDVSKSASDKIGIKYGNGGPFVTIRGSSRSSAFPFDEDLIERKTGEEPTFTTSESGYDFTGMTASLDFLKSQSDSRILARPKLLTLNNQTAKIEVSTDEAIGLSSTTTNTGNSSTSTTVAQAERKKTGVSLEVTPQANVATGEIILSVTPKVVSAKQGGTFGGQQFKDPEEQSATSVLKVKSGETVIIGGLLRVQENMNGSKLPFLGDVPVAGAVFRHKASDGSERELIIFITPYILDEKSKSDIKMDKKPMTLHREVNLPRDSDLINSHLDLAEINR